MIKWLKALASFAVVFGFATAHAQTTSIQLGVNRTVSPWQICAFDSTDQCQPFINLPSTGGGAYVPTANGGTGTINPTGFIYFNGASAPTTYTIPLPISVGGTGQTNFTANGPLLGNGTSAIAQGTRSGSTTVFATTNGTLTNGHCVSIDSGGNLVDAGGVCTTGGGGGTVISGLTNQLAYYNANGPVVVGLTTANSGVLVTSPSGVPSIGTTIPGGVAMGSALTFGTHLASGASSYNGSSSATITSDATSANTASTLVARDSSGNFSANNITSALTGHASADLQASNNLSDLASVSTSRTNLGLGSLATLNTINNGNWSGTPLAVTNGGTGTNSAGATAANNIGALAENNNLSDLASASSSRTNLGLGSLATLNNADTSHGGLYGATLNAIPYGGGAGALPSFAGPVNNAVLATNGSGVPAEATTLPSAVQANISQLANGAAASNLSTAAAPGIALGTSVSPAYQQAFTSQATSTSGSPTITITSGSIPSVGAIVDQPQSFGFPNETVVQSVASPNVTMTANATATHSTPAAIQFGANRWSSTSTFLTNAIGAMTGYFGGFSSAQQPAWTYQYDPPGSFAVMSGVTSENQVGGWRAGTFYGRLSDAVAGGQNALETLADFCVVDVGSVGTPYDTWCHYQQANLTTTTQGYHISEESDIWSGWATANADPYSYNPLGHVSVWRMTSGDGQHSGAQNISSYAEMINNGGAAEAGLIIGNGALDTTAGRIAPAVFMPQNTGLQWDSASATLLGQIYANIVGGFPQITLNVPTNGSYEFMVNGSGAIQVNATTVYPTANNTVSLGAGTNQYANIYGTTFIAGGTSGVTCSGAPTSSFASKGGIVTHC